MERRKRRGKSPSKVTFLSAIAAQVIRNYIRPKWERQITNVLTKEKNISTVLFMNVPLNHITGIPSKIRSQFGVPVAYYDGDLPTALPRYAVGRGFKFNYYEGADLSEYDVFFTNSEGCVPDLEEMGASNVHSLHYGIDPELCAPIDVGKDIDISFFGYGSDFREEWMEKLISVPSVKMSGVRFAVAGGGFRIGLGNAEMVGDLSYSEWRQFCCRSKINLNITRWSHTNVYASSTSRPFELAALGACIVSQPYNGIHEWFELGKELLIVNSADEAIETYERLLDNADEREKMGKQARERVLNEHTFRHRATELTRIIDSVDAISESIG